MRSCKLSQLILFSLCILTMLFGAVARAQDTSITFDDLKPGATGIALGNQYLTQGVRFESGAVYPNATAYTPPNSAFGFRSGELGTPYVRGVFSNPHHRYVTVWVENNVAEDVYLIGQDLGGNKIGEVDGKRSAQPGTYIPLTLSTPGRNLSVFIVGGNIGGSSVIVDDIRYDNIGTLEGPDFYFYPVGGTAILNPGGPPVSFNVNLGRRAGSTGGINISVSGLPPGITVASVTPNPVTGNSFKIALKAASGVQPNKGNYNQHFTITGTPNVSAGAYGPRTVDSVVSVVQTYDARIIGVEVTQGIQPYQIQRNDFNNPAAPVSYNQPGREGVGLAMDAITSVRVYSNLRLPEPGPVFSSDNVSTMPHYEYTLRGFRDGQQLPDDGGVVRPISPDSWSLPKYSNSIEAGILERTAVYPDGIATFTMPRNWTKGTLSLIADVREVTNNFLPTGHDCCADNNSFTLTDIAFTPTRQVYVAPFKLEVQGMKDPDDPTHTRDFMLEIPRDAFFKAKQVLPIGRYNFSAGSWAGRIDISDIWGQENHDCGFLGLSTCDTSPEDRAEYIAGRLRDVADDLNYQQGGSLVMGVYPYNSSDPKATDNDQYRIRGLKNRRCTGPFWDCDDLDVAIVQDRGRPLTSVAHEMGHLLGRAHAGRDCPGLEGSGEIQDWPGLNKGNLDGVGFDWTTGVEFWDTGNYFDFMSYCAGEGNAWISVKGWTETLDRLKIGNPGEIKLPFLTKPSTGSRPLQAPVPVLIVHAHTTPDGFPIITKVAPGTPRNPILPDPASPFHLIAKNDAGDVIADVGMHSDELETTHTDAHPNTMEFEFLSAQLPMEGVKSIEITNAGNLVAKRVRTDHAPVVALTEVTPDSVRAGVRLSRVKWTATDEDGDALTTKVDYSPDNGQTWRTIYFGPDKGVVELTPDLLIASEAGLIAIRVGDGFNETRVVSDPFKTMGSGPNVEIAQPKESQTIKAGASLSLVGSALDEAKAPITDGNLLWYDGDTLLGSGGSLTAHLAAGTHKLRLVATDAQGRTRSSKVNVQVNR